MRDALKLFVCLTFMFVFGAPALGADISIADMNRQIDQTNFLVNNNCSATLIDKDQGYLLTANHCVNDQFTIVERQKIKDDGTVETEKVRVAKPGTVSQLYFSGPDEVERRVYVFKIKDNDKDLDLALVKTDAHLPNKSQAAIACEDPRRLDKVYAVGNSYALLYSTVTSGIVSSTQRNYPMFGIDQGDHGLTQFSAPIVGGNSGGALYNDKFELIGVNVRGGATGFGFAVPLGDIKAFLKKNGLGEDCGGRH